ncbi:helix-turn-helix domain-containing protein [Clostridioides difficile]|nr:helix-turn-helix domain-containing protein [Clostridioides difficile]
MQTLKEVIKEYRKLNKLSLKDFSDLCDLSHTYIDKIEKCKDPRNGNPIEHTLDSLEKISLGLNLTLDELLIKLGKIKGNGNQIEYEKSNDTKQLLNTILSKNLKDLRTKKGLTQEQVAKDLMITKVSIGGYENATREPKIETLKSLSNYYNVSVDYLLGKTSIENYTTTDEISKIIKSYESLPKEAQEHINRYIEFLVDRYKK